MIRLFRTRSFFSTLFVFQLIMILKINAQTPQNFQKTLLSFDNDSTLRTYLQQQNLIDSTEMSILNETYEPEIIGCNGLEVDLFHKNLFGSFQPEAILQIRWQQMIYALSFYYQQAEKWEKIPGSITINQGSPENTPCLEARRCSGYFCFSFEALRNAQESVIVGKTWGGNCSGSGSSERGDLITQYIWQITPKGIHSLFKQIVREYFYFSPSPTPISERIERKIAFGPSSNGLPFPKQLIMISAIYPSADSLKEGEDWNDLPVDQETTIFELPFVK